VTDNRLTPAEKQRILDLYDEREVQRQAESAVNFVRAVRLCETFRQMRER
jgi:hypothetical protein